MPPCCSSSPSPSGEGTYGAFSADKDKLLDKTDATIDGNQVFDQDAYAANSWDWTLSALMCNVTGDAGASGVNPVSGKTWDWQNYYGYVYDGEMWMEAGTTYTLGGNFDDGSAILIDGAVAWAQGDPGGTGSGYNNWVAPRTYTPDTTGWHTVKLLVWDWEGGKTITSGALSATMWNTNGTTTAAPTSAWSKFADDGSGALFRAKLADTYLHVVTAGATAGGYAVTVENLAPQAVEMKIFAGAADLGETDAGWTSESQSVSFAAGETKDIEFAWTAGGMPVYRIRLSGTDASLQAYGDFWEWSEARTFLFVPSIAAAFVSTNDTSATVSVTCGYAESMTGSSPDIAVTAYYGRTNGGHDPSAWANSTNYPAMQPGTFADTFTCLLGTRCSVVFAASINGGEPVWSDVLTFGVTLISPNDFAYRADVTFPGFTGATPLSDFPVLVRLTETPGGFSYAQAAAGGADLRFALADGTPLDSEIAVWDETGESLVWVRLPELADDTSIVLYWGGTDTSFPDSQTDGSVWGDASYVGVWHLEESGDTLADATANGLDGTRHGTVGRVAAGLAGAGHRISDGSSGVGIGIPNYDALSVGDSFTISAWFVYPQGQTPGYDRLFSRKSNYNDGNGWEVTLRNGSKQNLDHRGANGDAQDSAVFADIADGQWHYLAVAYNGNTSSVFVDGVQKVSGKAIGAAPTDNGKTLAFGNNAAYAETTFKGTLDEIRLRDAVTDAAWAAAEWASVSDPDFAVIGPAEAIDLDMPSIVPPANVSASHHAVSFAWTLRDAGSSASTVVAELGTESGVYTRTVTLESALSSSASDTATIGGLQCATTYYLRLSASNASGTVSSAETTFSTPGGVSFSGESLAASGASEVTAAATVSSANPDATVSVSLFFGAAGATPAARRTWTATTNPQTFTESVSGLLFGDYEAHFEAEATCSVCSGVSTASSETVSATLAGECRWTGAAGDLSWNTPGNWSSGTVPGPMDTAVFPAGSVGDGATIALDANQSVAVLLDQSGVSFQIGSADDVSEARVLSVGDYVRSGEANVTLLVATPFRFAATESGTNGHGRDRAPAGSPDRRGHRRPRRRRRHPAARLPRRRRRPPAGTAGRPRRERHDRRRRRSRPPELHGEPGHRQHRQRDGPDQRHRPAPADQLGLHGPDDDGAGRRNHPGLRLVLWPRHPPPRRHASGRIHELRFLFRPGNLLLRIPDSVLFPGRVHLQPVRRCRHLRGGRRGDRRPHDRRKHLLVRRQLEFPLQERRGHAPHDGHVRRRVVAAVPAQRRHPALRQRVGHAHRQHAPQRQGRRDARRHRLRRRHRARQRDGRRLRRQPRHDRPRLHRRDDRRPPLRNAHDRLRIANQPRLLRHGLEASHFHRRARRGRFPGGLRGDRHDRRLGCP